MKVKCVTCDQRFDSNSDEAKEHLKHDWDFYPDEIGK